MKILMISLSNIGDAIMTTPVLERLHQIYPTASIDLVCDRRSSELFQHCPYRGTHYHKDKKAGWKGVLQLIRQLRKTRYELVVDLRTDGLAWLLRAKQRLTKWNHKAYGPHAVEDLISIIDRINPDRQIPECQVWLSEAEQEHATTLTQTLPEGRWLALAPGANWEPKIWSTEYFSTLVQKLQSQFSGIVLLGGPGDKDRCQTIAQHCELPCVNLAGQTGLLDAAAILKKTAFFIGNDSGLGHIASAVGTPTMTLFGPGNPERYHPWGKSAHWLTSPENNLGKLTPEAVATTILDMESLTRAS